MPMKLSGHTIKGFGSRQWIQAYGFHTESRGESRNARPDTTVPCDVPPNTFSPGHNDTILTRRPIADTCGLPADMIYSQNML